MSDEELEAHEQGEDAEKWGPNIKNLKEDHRPPKGGWADGDYLCHCFQCRARFAGDKRAYQCADCAYREPV